MATKARKKEDTRVEFRVSREEKELFEYASNVKGYKSFSEFARLTLQKEAKAIVEAESIVLASKRDQKIFFNAIMGKEEKPNPDLIAALSLHHQMTSK